MLIANNKELDQFLREKKIQMNYQHGQNINYLIPSNLKQVKKQKKKTIMESTIAPQAAKIKLEM